MYSTTLTVRIETSLSKLEIASRIRNHTREAKPFPFQIQAPFSSLPKMNLKKELDCWVGLVDNDSFIVRPSLIGKNPPIWFLGYRPALRTALSIRGKISEKEGSTAIDLILGPHPFILFWQVIVATLISGVGLLALLSGDGVFARLTGLAFFGIVAGAASYCRFVYRTTASQEVQYFTDLVCGRNDLEDE